MNTYDSLYAKGMYVNDYPGIGLDGKELSFFLFRVGTPDVLDLFTEGGPGPRPEKDFAKFFPKFQGAITRYNQAAGTLGTDRELRVFYGDDLGFYLVGRVDGDKADAMSFTLNERQVRGDLVFNLLLERVYSGEGLDGVRQVRLTEVKNAHVALQKFLTIYELGWKGLFRQRSEREDIESLFRSFVPFKVPFFGKKEFIKRPRLTVQLGLRTSAGDEYFKPVSVAFKDITLTEVADR